ncbi:tryptophan synthase alpha chain [Bacillus pakistanensis]|uniref:Tryptophan synthase alpha chain n=1 Tax=Rossellomorea pakistanensis TaxID=992288 RepID=A0ABS2N8H2_9BACI|nr:tryptophan synthase subunit alpha [Bacillus pakistanensis]MBM7584163.1 tryptophan synthase alpha chain [Bacillus pakistanensis]
MGKKFLEKTLIEELEQGGKNFIPYVMAGDGGLEKLIPTLKSLAESGASAIELGIPFSDPVADGPTIQEAGKRALANGTSLRNVIQVLIESRKEVSVPLIFMTYINPIYKYGVEEFVRDISEAGVDGVIIPDLPLEQSSMVSPYFEKADIALIQLVSLTSSEKRMEEIANASQGFLYAVTVNGITGARSEFTVNLEKHLQKLKEVSQVPVLAGFGISTPAHVISMSALCDGVIVGSKIIEHLQENNHKAIKELIQAKNVEPSFNKVPR